MCASQWRFFSPHLFPNKFTAKSALFYIDFLDVFFFSHAIAQQFLRVKFFFFPERRCSILHPTKKFHPFSLHFLSRILFLSISSLRKIFESKKDFFELFHTTKIFHFVLTFKTVQCILLFLQLRHMRTYNLQNCVVLDPWIEIFRVIYKIVAYMHAAYHTTPI